MIRYEVVIKIRQFIISFSSTVIFCIRGTRTWFRLVQVEVCVGNLVTSEMIRADNL